MSKDPFLYSSSQNSSGSISVNGDGVFNTMIVAVLIFLIILVVSLTIYFVNK